jgi:hypothetical protein
VNILILGGIIVVALAALVGAVLLNIGEERAEKAQQAARENASALLPQQSQPTQPTPPSPAVVEHPTDQSTGQLVPLKREVSLSDLNDQFYEISSALLMLAQRIGEMELRLGDLTTVLERREASGRTEVTEITDHQMRVPDFNRRTHS